MIRGIITLLLLVILSVTPVNAGQKWNNNANHQDITGEIPIGTAPANSTAACYKGRMEHDAAYLYLCVDTNTWKRATLATWSVTDVLLLSTGDKVLLSDGTSNILIRP